MKKGDIVTIKDGSYAVSVIHGKLAHESLNYGIEWGKQYIVVETECVFPLVDNYQTRNYRNDTVIQALAGEGNQTLSRGKVVFIHGCFLQKCQIREVTMTEVCNQFGEEVKIIK